MSESYEREALHLISIEKEFIRQIELGVQLYSRPLKHYLISSHEHGKLFQNIEKVMLLRNQQDRIFESIFFLYLFDLVRSSPYHDIN